MSTRILAGARLFDGDSLQNGLALVIEQGEVAALCPADEVTPTTVLDGGILAPGFVDLQVNGGGGVMLDAAAGPGTLGAICDAHARLGCAVILPTLITATPETTLRVIDLAVQAADLPGCLGLHLEGPHLDPSRKGAHDAARIRPMTDDDLAVYLVAARRLSVLMLTLSPGAATPDQIASLAAVGVRVHLGHSDCTAAEARAAFAAGASGATHLFNAMSQLTSRSPGLVGAVLAGTCAAGLIADGHHIAPEALRVALAARPEGLFLVSDAMAVAGTALEGFQLDGRPIRRAGGRLTLADGTLAGADLTMAQAVRVLVTQAGCPLPRALAMATRIPADVVGAGGRMGRIAAGRKADLVHLNPAGDLVQVWRRGEALLA